MTYGILGLGFSLLILVAGHGVTLRTPAPCFDDVAYGQMALFGRKTLAMESRYPPACQFQRRFYGGMFATPVQLALVRLSLKAFGISVPSSRAVPITFGLGALAVWAFLAVSQGQGWVAGAALLFVGLGYPVFKSFHTVRPEGFVLFAMTVNYAWFVSEREEQSLAFAAGTLSTLALGAHLAASILWITMGFLILAVRGKSCLRDSRWKGWSAGALAGAVVVLASGDWSAASAALPFVHRIVVRPPLLQWNGSLSAYVGTVLHTVLGEANLSQNSWQGALVGVGLSVTAWQLRRWRGLALWEKAQAVICLSSVACASLLNASSASHYFIYAFPWLGWQLWVGIGHWGGASWRLERADLSIFTALNFVVLGSGIHGLPTFIFFFLSAPLLASEILSRDLRAYAALSLVALFLLVDTNVLFSMMTMARYLAVFRPWWLAVYILGPWIIYYVGTRCAEHPYGSRWLGRWLLVGYMTVVATGYLAADVRRTSVEIRESTLTVSDRERLAALRQKKVVLGPSELWLYDPAIPLQSSLGLTFIADRAELGRALCEMQPDILILDPSLSRALKERLPAGVELQRIDSWTLPVGAFQEFVLKCT